MMPIRLRGSAALTRPTNCQPALRRIERSIRHRFGQRELLARETRDESPASRSRPLASRRWKTLNNSRHGGSSPSALEQPLEDHTVAPQKFAQSFQPARGRMSCGSSDRTRVSRQQTTNGRRWTMVVDHAPSSSKLESCGLKGSLAARSPVKLSAVTSPQATSSPSASSTCEVNKPVPSVTSLKNDAPCLMRRSRRQVPRPAIARPRPKIGPNDKRIPGCRVLSFK